MVILLRALRTRVQADIGGFAARSANVTSLKSYQSRPNRADPRPILQVSGGVVSGVAGGQVVTSATLTGRDGRRRG